MDMAHTVVSVNWLEQALNEPNLVVLYTSMKDISTGLPEPAPAGYIPGSQFFDFEQQICDSSSGLPHTMPDTETFNREVQKLGINKDSKIVVYDNKGIYSAPRVWWMLKAMGHEHVFVLDGGLPLWRFMKCPLQKTLSVSSIAGNFRANYRPERIFSASDVHKHIGAPNSCIIDARSAGRFNGSVAEPRAGLRSGHIPSSLSLPFTECLKSGALSAKSVLENKFSQLNVTSEQQLIFSCGSGVTACILALAASHIGFDQVAVYDGSWSEWGARTDLPIES